MTKWGPVVLMLTMIIAGCGATSDAPEEGVDLMVRDDIVELRAQFVPLALTAEISHLSDGDREALRHLVVAAEAMDEIFTVQAWVGNPEFASRVGALEGPRAAAARDYYRIMVGPWDRLDHHRPFLGDRPHPPAPATIPKISLRPSFQPGSRRIRRIVRPSPRCTP